VVTDNTFDQFVEHAGPLVLGEIHGTTEIPRLASSLVERIATSGRPVRLCLELAPQDVQHELPETSNWWRFCRDGRSSTAMAELIDHVWQLSSRYDVACEGLLPDTFDERALPRWERTMADRLVETVRRNPDAFVVALVGNGHSRVDYIDCPYPTAPMAALALAEVPELRSLRIITSGGTAWVCTDPDRPAAPTIITPAAGSHQAPGIHWWTEITEHHHGTWVIGAITVSLPAVSMI
jgi:hypothetical protein